MLGLFVEFLRVVGFGESSSGLSANSDKEELLDELLLEDSEDDELESTLFFFLRFLNLITLLAEYGINFMSSGSRLLSQRSKQILSFMRSLSMSSSFSSLALACFTNFRFFR